MVWKKLFGIDRNPEPGGSSGAPDPSRPAPSPTDLNDRLEAAKRRHRAGHAEEADAVYREILAQDPRHPGAQHMVGVVLLQRGRLQEAEQSFRLAIEQDENNADFHSNLGNALSAQGRVEEAYDCYRRAIEKDGGHVTALGNAASALISLGRPGEAKPLCQQILELSPEDSDAKLNLAACYIEEHHYTRAIAVLEKGLENQPDHIEMLVQLASAQELANRLDEAAQTTDRIEALQPGIARVALLSGLVARRRGDLELGERKLRDALSRGLAANEQVEAFNQLGLTLDALGKPGEAFGAFAQSNRLMAEHAGVGKSAGTGYRETVDQVREYFSPERFDALATKHDSDDELAPVFFVGFPRSGTTLMEQVLKAHPGLVTTEERSPLMAVLQEFERNWGAYPEALEKMEPADIDGLRSRFRRACEEYIPDYSGRQVVDKLPLNMVHVAFARLLFPRCRILVALRDPRDACLSCFMQKFELNEAMANFLQLESTAKTYEAVMGLWLEHRALLSGSWMEYRYENLVADFEGTVRQVLEFIGVGWDDAISGYRQAAATRAITTPSYRDVTQPVNARAVERWRNYQQELGPILPRLEPFVEAFGYAR